MDRFIWKNGEILPEYEATVSIYDSAMMLGDTIFTMLRTFNKELYLIDEHLERLFDNLKYVRMSIPYDKYEIKNALYDVMDANKFNDDDEHRLMINCTRGLLSLYQDVEHSKGPNVIIADFPLKWTVAGMGKLFDEGINMITPNQRSIPSRLLDAKVKCRSRLHYLMANIEVSQYAGENNWALLLDEDGFVAEGTGDNFFIVKDKIIYTPEPRNILRGITRKRIMKMAHVVEKNIDIYDVMTADEAFISGTPFVVLPVVSLNGVKIGTGKTKDYTEFWYLLSKWCCEYGVNIKEQIQEWDKKYVELQSRKGASPYKFKENKI